MTTNEHASNFDVEIDVEDRQIKAVHRKHGYEFTATWDTEPPHIRNLHLRPAGDAEGLVEDAKKAMLDKLREHDLI
jgi:hypothetical protein